MKKKWLFLILSLWLVVLLIVPLFSSLQRVEEPAINPALRYYMCHRPAEPIIIDGRLDEPSWKKVYWSEDFVNIDGKRRPKPRFKTRAKMLWDDQYFYFGAEIEEPHVWATLTARDSIIYQDNDFEIFIDPDGDSHNYYELEINALNTVWDLFLVKPYRDGGPAIHGWDIKGLKTAVYVDGTLNNPADQDKGWSVEIAIPWEALIEAAPYKKKPGPGDQWRVNFSRVEYQTVVENGVYAKMKDKRTGRPLPEYNWTWAPQGLINIHYPEMWGYVQFSSTVAGQAKEYCDEDPAADVKWALRLIYYRQRDFFTQTGRFALNLEELDLNKEKKLKVKNWDYPPMIQATSNLFEVIYTNKKAERWHIRQDGLIWKTEAN